jgi:hypothetical protein
MADLVQAFDMIQAFMRLTAASHLWEPRALNETCAALAGPRAPQTPGSLALAAAALYKTFSARSRCLGHYVAAGGASWAATLFGRPKVMSLSGSNNDRPVPEGGNPALSGAAGSRKAAERLRLAQALRANLGRRKAQKRERRKQTADAAESKTARGEGAQNGASTKQD